MIILLHSHEHNHNVSSYFLHHWRINLCHNSCCFQCFEMSCIPVFSSSIILRSSQRSGKDRSKLCTTYSISPSKCFRCSSLSIPSHQSHRTCFKHKLLRLCICTRIISIRLSGTFYTSFSFRSSSLLPLHHHLC